MIFYVNLLILSVMEIAMRYKTRHPDSYLDGRVNITFTISVKAYRWLQERENASAIVNDLICDSMEMQASPEAKSLLAEVNKAKIQLEKMGWNVTVDKVQDENSGAK